METNIAAAGDQLQGMRCGVSAGAAAALFSRAVHTVPYLLRS